MGSTSRMYHRDVTSSPRSVRATRSETVPVPPADSRRLSLNGACGSPVSPAVYRVVGSRRSTPSVIQSVLDSGRPLSKTDTAGVSESVEERATTNGRPSTPGAAGSLQRFSGSAASRSPTRVPPPARLKTVRPSWAFRASDIQCW